MGACHPVARALFERRVGAAKEVQRQMHTLDMHP